MESRSCRKALFVFKDNSFVFKEKWIVFKDNSFVFKDNSFVFKDNSFVFKDKWIVFSDKVVLKVVPFCSILLQCRINKMDTNTNVSTARLRQA